MNVRAFVAKAPPVASSRSTLASAWPLLLEGAALLAILLCLLLALLWLERNPIITAFDEVGHIDNSLSDALILRSGDGGLLRDSLFLWNRWLPPGLRIVGLPIAYAFWPVAPEALRISAAVMFLLTALALWLALRPLAGRAGAAAGVLLYALAPINLFGAQNFMTESVLHLCAALALLLLALEARAANASVLRMGLLGLVLGLGILTKLTFLPAYALFWLGFATWRWWQERNNADLLIRLALPTLGLLLVAWPHYALNGARYIGYARATADGYAFIPWPETGLAFAARAVRTLVADVFGPGGTVVLMAGLVLLAMSWRRAAEAQRLMLTLAVLSGLPTLAAFLFSHNQTDRYLGLTLIGLCVPVAVGFGLALQAMPRPRPVPFLAGAAGIAALLQVGLGLLIGWSGPLPGWPASGLVQANWRPNYDCDYSPLTALVPPDREPAAVGIFGTTQTVNRATVQYAFLRAGRRAAVYDLVEWGQEPDWDAIIMEASRQDLLVIPSDVRDSDSFPANHMIPEFRERLAAAGVQVADRGETQTGSSSLCTVRVLIPEPATAIKPARGPFRSEVHPLP
ncbi:MAG: glycosyltransferase family 39 protein [Acetobacteraceae bacterium]|nr:glycosyltransferase family 39 protein [Acetobacteraceae bacterium]